MNELKIKTPSEFAAEIEELVRIHNLEYIDAVVLYCERNNLEIESAASLIRLNANMKAKVQTEAENLRFLPKVSRLPI
jgi:hypothetical protein